MSMQTDPGKDESSPKSGLLKDVASTTILGVVGKGTGFLIPFFIAAWYGANREMDTFFFTLGIIHFLSIMLTSTVSTVIVPYISEERSKGKDVGAFTGSVILYSSIILLGLALLFMLILNPLLSLVTRFDKESINAAVLLFFELIPLVFLFLYGGIFEGVLNAYKQFAVPAVSPALRAIIAIGIIYLFKNVLGIHAIVAGYLVGEAIRLLLLTGSLLLLKYPFPRFSLKTHPLIGEFLKKASFQAFAAIIVSFSTVIDKTMVSWLKEGSVSLLYYGERLYLVPVNLFVTGLVVTLLSHWSAHYYGMDSHQLDRRVKKAIKITALVTIPLTVLLIICYKPIVWLAFGHGTFDTRTLSDIGSVYMMYLAGFGPYILTQIYARGHIVLKNTSALLVCALLMTVFNIGGNIILMRYLRETGIALATSIVNMVSFLFLMIMFKRKVALNGKK